MLAWPSRLLTAFLRGGRGHLRAPRFRGRDLRLARRTAAAYGVKGDAPAQPPPSFQSGLGGVSLLSGARLCSLSAWQPAGPPFEADEETMRGSGRIALVTEGSMTRRAPTEVLIVCIALFVMKGLALLLLPHAFGHSVPTQLREWGFSPATELLLGVVGPLPGLVAAIAMLMRRNWGRILYFAASPVGIIAGGLHARSAHTPPVSPALLMASALTIPLVIYAIFVYLLTRPSSNSFFRDAPTAAPSVDAGPRG